jgi:uncharacterized protein YlaI
MRTRISKTTWRGIIMGTSDPIPAQHVTRHSKRKVIWKNTHKFTSRCVPLNATFVVTHSKLNHTSRITLPTCTVKDLLRSLSVNENPVNMPSEQSICFEHISLFTEERSLSLVPSAHPHFLPDQVYLNTLSLSMSCSLCEFTTTDKGNLATHVRRIHTKERPYSCSLCEMTFPDSGSRILHVQRKHTREDSHSCAICSRKFVTRNEMNVHFRTHNRGKKSFKCSFCKKRFATKTNLGIHIRAHVG